MADLLEQLEREFGIAELQTESVVLYGHKWTLRKLDYDDVDKANQFIFRRNPDSEEGDDENPLSGVEPLVFGFRSSLGFVAVSLSAIDDQPVCFVFKTAKLEEVAPFNPLAPVARIRHRTADRVHRFLSSSKKNMDLIMQLYDLYTEKLDDRTEQRKKGKEEQAAEASSAAGTEAAPANPLTESGQSPPASAG